MKRSLTIIAWVAAGAAAFGAFIALAQAHAIFVPYFTPTRIEFEGLKDHYSVNSSMDYTISLKGYGSNCVTFTAEMFREDSSLPEGEERVAYFNRVQDCRIIKISEGPYSYSHHFTYGDVVISKAGNYWIDVAVLDQVERQNYNDTRAFRIGQEIRPHAEDSS